VSGSSQFIDVLVVGAGIGGLAAARSLAQQGFSVRVLEARQRAGGRLCSVDSLDLGATWFWPGETRVERLVAELGIEIHEQHLAGDALFETPSGVRRLPGNPVDVLAYRFRGGASQLAEAVARDLPSETIRYGEVVRKIDATPGGVTVTAAEAVEAESAATDSRVDSVDRVYEARDVVLALPPVLAVRRVEFSPALPESLARVAASTPVWMGAIAKVVARYEKPFWRDDGLAGAVVSYVGPMREIHDMSGPEGLPAALFGFAPAGADVTEAAVCRQFGDLFGPLAEDPEELHIQDWPRERFTVPDGASSLSDYSLFGHQVYQTPALHGRVHWASTETATENPGHIEGALAAAERAVATILGR